MSEPVELICQQAISNLIEAPDTETQEAALAAFDTICSKNSDKEILIEQLTQSLQREERGSNRTLLISALSRINAPGTAKIIATYLDPEKEKSERVRYKAMVALSALDEVQASDLKKYLRTAPDEDPSFRVRAVALRLLIEEECGEEYVEQLLKMTEAEAMVDERWAALKALRNEAGNRHLPEQAERKFLKVAQQHLADESEWRDVRYQAALVLGDVTHRRADATWAVSQCLRRNPPKSVLLNCIDALAQLNDRELAKTDEQEKARLNDPDNQREVREALLFGLQHNDPTVSLRAIEAIKRVMTPYQAVNFIIEDLLRQPDPPDGYFDALRHIDGKGAAKLLSDNLMHPDQDLAEQASKALTKLGGAEALRSLQAQRAYMLNKYTELLDHADKQIMGQFERLMKNARFAFRMSMVMHGVTFGVGILLILTSIYLILRPQEAITPTGYWLQVLGPGVGGGIVTLLTLFYKDPLKHIGQSVDRLVKVNVVFLGYVRQINQIDATFKQMFLTTSNFGAGQMEKTVHQIQESVDLTLARVQTYLAEPQDNGSSPNGG